MEDSFLQQNVHLLESLLLSVSRGYWFRPISTWPNSFHARFQQRVWQAVPWWLYYSRSLAVPVEWTEPTWSVHRSTVFNPYQPTIWAKVVLYCRMSHLYNWHCSPVWLPRVEVNGKFDSNSGPPHPPHHCTPPLYPSLLIIACAMI
jgi:hypothetical protein